jgi:hypothetical protein
MVAVSITALRRLLPSIIAVVALPLSAYRGDSPLESTAAENDLALTVDKVLTSAEHPAFVAKLPVEALDVRVAPRRKRTADRNRTLRLRPPGCRIDET